LVCVYVGLLVHSHVTHPHRQKKFRNDHLQRGLIAGAAASVFFGGQQMFSKTDAHRILMGFTHAAAGFACYEFWQVLPPPPRGKKLDDVTGMGASFV